MSDQDGLSRHLDCIQSDLVGTVRDVHRHAQRVHTLDDLSAVSSQAAVARIRRSPTDPVGSVGELRNPCSPPLSRNDPRPNLRAGRWQRLKPGRQILLFAEARRRPDPGYVIDALTSVRAGKQVACLMGMLRILTSALLMTALVLTCLLYTSRCV